MTLDKGVFPLKNKNLSPEDKFIEKVQSDSHKKIKAQNEGKEILFGFGLFGIVGWSIAIPTLIGIALGIQFDRIFDSSFSWTLTLLFAGIILGCFNAWHWVKEKSNDD